MLRNLVIWAIGMVLVLPAKGQDGGDPNLWLEEVIGDKALAWVKERNAESIGELTRPERFRALEHRLLEILDSDARIPSIQKLGRSYYNF